LEDRRNDPETTKTEHMPEKKKKGNSSPIAKKHRRATASFLFHGKADRGTTRKGRRGP